jgi:hypothetical protein
MLAPMGAPPEQPFLTLATVRRTLQASMDSWTGIPTSFMEMRIVSTTANTGDIGFDFVNELTFVTDPNMPGGFIGASPSVALMQRALFEVGNDLDGDGDSDVAADLATCADADGDGDIEFPPGVYEAGTILDNDVIFNAAGFRFTATDDALDTNPNSVDLQSIATHELGHSQGLSHSSLNQRSDRDGNAATMFPFVNTADPDSERAQRLPDSEGRSITSQKYPEGTAESGPAALQAGDLAAGEVLGEIVGSVTSPNGVPIAGANVFCRNADTKVLVSTTFSGETRLGLDTQGAALLFPPEISVANGDFRFLLRPASYECGVEPIDGAPVDPGQLNTTTLIGDLLEQQSLLEELFNGTAEAAVEASPGAAARIEVAAGEQRSGVRFITNLDVTIDGVNRESPPAAAIAGAPGLIAVLSVPGKTLLELSDSVRDVLGARGVIAIQRAEFSALIVDSSTVPVFAAASINRCSRSIDAMTGLPTLQIDLQDPLRMVTGFVAQDDDLAPLFFDDPLALGEDVLNGLINVTHTDVCIALRYADGPFPGVSAQPPFLLVDGAEATVATARSFISEDGGATFQPLLRNLRFSLGLTPIRP